MLWLTVIALAFASLAVVLFFESRRQDRSVLRDWNLVLTPKGQREFERATERIEARLGLVDFAYDSATSALHHGSTEDALALLDQGCELIERHCPTMIRALGAISVLSRMVSALAPQPPLRAKALRLRQLVQLAYLYQFLSYFLVTTAERFRLRTAILARCFSTLGRIAFRSRRRARTENDAVRGELPTFDAARRDARVLSEESIATFRVLLEALAAEQRDL